MDASTITKRVTLDLEQQNDNAFHLLGAFASTARQEGWTSYEIDAVRDEAMASDHDHLLRTLIRYVDHPGDAG
jgi:hypothetical protein